MWIIRCLWEEGGGQSSQFETVHDTQYSDISDFEDDAFDKRIRYVRFCCMF